MTRHSLPFGFAATAGRQSSAGCSTACDGTPRSTSSARGSSCPSGEAAPGRGREPSAARFVSGASETLLMRFAVPTGTRVAIAQFVTSLFGHLGVGTECTNQLRPVLSFFEPQRQTVKERWRASVLRSRRYVARDTERPKRKGRLRSTKLRTGRL